MNASTFNILRNQAKLVSVKNARYLSVSRINLNITKPDNNSNNTNNNNNGKDFSPISNAPKWNHDNATASEQSVKADYEPDHDHEKFKKSTHEYLNKKYPKKQHNN